MRLFIAIHIPDEIKQQMAEVQDRIRISGVDASWPRPEGMHLTLKFLGEIQEQKAKEIAEALVRVAEKKEPFRLELQGVGAFPDPKNARVVWIGLSGDREKLNMLQADVEQAMAALGMEREKRAFKPHLTIGRIKYIRSRDRWLAALEQVKDVSLPGFEVRRVSLMMSELKRTGAEYTQIANVELR